MDVRRDVKRRILVWSWWCRQIDERGVPRYWKNTGGKKEESSHILDSRQHGSQSVVYVDPTQANGRVDKALRILYCLVE